MTNREDISRIAKILARSTSSEPHEADTALRAAYKRMRRDHVDMRQLLTLPLEELYQESLTKLVTLILDEQPELLPAERRKAFQNYMALINARFIVGSTSSASSAKSTGSTGSTGRGSADEVHKAQQKRNEEDSLKAAEHKARSEADIRRRQEEFRQREQAFREREEALRQREHETRSSQQQAPPPPFGSTRQQAAGAASGSGTHTQHPKKRPRPGGGTGQSAAAPDGPSSGWSGVVSFLIFCVFVAGVVLYQKKYFQTGWRTTLAAASASSAAPGSSASTSPSAMPVHAVAAARANLRSKATVSSKIQAVLKRGDAVEVQALQGTFLQIKLADGQVGFISRELVIPWNDFKRLQHTSAQDYIALRAPEKRVERLFEHTEKQKDAFLGALHSLSNGGASVAGHLRKMQGVPQFNVSADAAASTWFSLSAAAARSAGEPGQAMLEALAAIEADPANPQRHVAFAWDNYRAERYEVVRTIGKFLPKIAPASSDAWLLFGFSNGLTPRSDDVLTQSAFVLALQLSKNPEATRRHFQELAVSPYHPHIRKMLDAALADGRARPGLLDSVQRL